MPRPSITGMFDSTARIWRPVSEKDVIGVEQPEYIVIGELGCAINRSRAPSVDIGPGTTPVGSIRLYFVASANIEPRDVLEVLTGPDAGRTWEVNEPPVRPRGHHTQVDCIEWSGKLPEIGS